MIEHLCVYQPLNKSFSYFERCRKKCTDKCQSKYEEIIQKKCIQYRWKKQISYEDCLHCVLRNLDLKNEQTNGEIEQIEERYNNQSNDLIDLIKSSIKNISYYKKESKMKKAMREMYSKKNKKKRTKNWLNIMKNINEKYEKNHLEEPVNNEISLEDAKKDHRKNLDNIYTYLFNSNKRKKFYKKSKKKWIKNFIKLYGVVHVEVIEKIIDYLIIKNIAIFDTSFSNFFIHQNMVNHMNLNVCFVVGNSGEDIKEFIEKLFLSFPFRYFSEEVTHINIMHYEKNLLVCDYQYIKQFITNKNKTKEEKRSSFKLYEILNKKGKYSKGVNLMKDQISQTTTSTNTAKRISIGDDTNYHLINNCTISKDNNDTSISMIMKINNIKEFNEHKKIDSDTASSFEFGYLEEKIKGTTRLEKKINLKNNHFTDKIMYPTYYPFILKEKIISSNIVQRNSIRTINLLELNLEYQLISTTKIAVAKQLVCKRKIFQWLIEFFKKKEKSKEKIRLNTKTLGLHLFNGGMTFLLIENFQHLEKLPFERKKCILLLLLKYICLWKRMNLNIHLFIDVVQEIQNADSYYLLNESEGILTYFQSFLSSFFVLFIPHVLYKEDRKTMLKHFYHYHKIPQRKKKIEQIGTEIKNWGREKIMQLCKNECRERMKNIMKKQKLTDHLILQKTLVEEFQKYKKQHFKNALTKLQEHELSLPQEVELYKRKKIGIKEKNEKKQNQFGFKAILAEKELMKKIKKEIVDKFNKQEYYPSGKKKIIQPQGVILYGSNGTGKTLIAKKIIEECNSDGIIVNCSNVFNKVMGESEKYLNEIFQCAKNKLRPCIIFFDNIENICNKEEEISEENKFSKRLKLCFYENLDQVHFESTWKCVNSPILVIATTTSLNMVDTNLLKNHRVNHIYKTKNFKQWKEEDIFKLFEQTIENSSIENKDFLHSLKFKNFIKSEILSRKDKLTPLNISNICRDVIVRKMEILLKDNKKNANLEVCDFEEALAKITTFYI